MLHVPRVTFPSETYQRQKADLDELRKEWVGEMDKCSNLEVCWIWARTIACHLGYNINWVVPQLKVEQHHPQTGFNALNLNIVDSLHNLLQLLKPSVSLPSVDANVSITVL